MSGTSFINFCDCELNVFLSHFFSICDTISPGLLATRRYRHSKHSGTCTTGLFKCTGFSISLLIFALYFLTEIHSHECGRCIICRYSDIGMYIAFLNFTHFTTWCVCHLKPTMHQVRTAWAERASSVNISPHVTSRHVTLGHDVTQVSNLSFLGFDIGECS